MAGVERGLECRRLVVLRLDRSRELPVALLERAERVGLLRHGDPRGPRVADDVGVVLGREVQEVDPVEEIAEAVGLHDDAEDIRRVALVRGDKVSLERGRRCGEPVLHRCEVVARGDQLLLDAAQLRLPSGQRAPGRREPALGPQEPGGPRLDLGGVVGDRGVKSVERGALGVDAALKIGVGARADREQSETDATDRRDDPPSRSAREYLARLWQDASTLTRAVENPAT